MKRLIVVLTAAVGMAVPASAAARQEHTLDQQQLVSTHLAEIDRSFSWAQGFTAGLSGWLDQVDLYLSSRATGGAPLTVEIRTAHLSDLEPEETVLARTSLPASEPPPTGTEQFVPVRFASPAQLVAGRTYAIVAYISDAVVYYADVYYWGFAWNVFDWAGAYVSYDSPPTGWYPEIPDSFAFKTYICSRKKCNNK